MWSPEVFNLKKVFLLSLSLNWKDKLLFDDIFDGFLPADVLKSEIGCGHRQLNDSDHSLARRGEESYLNSHCGMTSEFYPREMIQQ